ncbi:MAG: hypothetical protein WCV70_00315 [Patescibacteria group bacterium]|jgi:hypothetical protein
MKINNVDLVIPKTYFTIFLFTLIGVFTFPIVDGNDSLIIIDAFSLVSLAIGFWLLLNKGILYKGIIDSENIFNRVEGVGRMIDKINNPEKIKKDIILINPVWSIIFGCFFVITGVGGLFIMIKIKYLL